MRVLERKPRLGLHSAPDPHVHSGRTHVEYERAIRDELRTRSRNFRETGVCDAEERRGRCGHWCGHGCGLRQRIQPELGEELARTTPSFVCNEISSWSRTLSRRFY
jgi:hypothetical protein